MKDRKVEYMKLGMPTLLELGSIEDCAEVASELDLDFIELNMNMPYYQTNTIDIELLREIGNSYTLSYTMHIEETLNPCDFNKKVSKAYIETMVDAIKIAGILQIPTITMHLNEGVYFNLPFKKIYLYSVYEDIYLENMKFFRNEVELAVGDKPIKICIENCGNFQDIPYIRHALDLLLESEVFGLTFDIGHNATAGNSDEGYILSHIDRLVHMHIHDEKEGNNHLALGEGKVDLKKYIAMAQKYNCRVVVEVKTLEGLKHSVEWIKNNI